MTAASPLRFVNRAMLLLPVALLYACSDNSTPLAPRFDVKPLATAAPVVTVLNTDDAGTGSLRQAVIDAPDGAVIQFDAGIAGGTIVLTSGQIFIDKSLTIEGPLPAGITVSGNHLSRVFYTDFGTDIVVRNLSIVNGNDQTSGGGGGGMWVSEKVLLDHVLLANNETGNTGGAIFVKSNGQLTLVNSTVSGNTADDGGGILSGAPVTIWNSTIVNNTATQGAGGIVVGLNANVSLRNSIVANNVLTGTLGAPNCRASSGSAILSSGTNMSNDNSCGTDPSIIIADPMIGPLAPNGGPTMTHALLFGSPAVDAGSACTETTDQRYVARNQNTSCDIGAFEFDAFATATFKISPNVAMTSKTGVATVSGTITCSAGGTFTLDVSLSQTQKTTGRFTTIVQGAAQTAVSCTGTSSWSATITPTAGKFEKGSGSARVSAATYPGGYLSPADVTASVKLFQSK